VADVGTDEPILVTTAGLSPRQEQRQRTRRYLVTMGVRVVCLVLAIVLFQLDLRWAAAFAIAGSLILPWIAVVAANAGPKRSTGQPELYLRDEPKRLRAGRD
jgi:hypothetical protein